jgi:hypothetical protein
MGVMWLLGRIVRITARIRGRRRCHYCDAKLELASGEFGFSDSCITCHRTQPWAKDVRARTNRNDSRPRS